MMVIAKALLRSWISDRGALVLGMIAPIALFCVLAMFYEHLGTDRAAMPRIEVSDHSGTPDGAMLAAALRAASNEGSSGSGLGALATLVVQEGTTRDAVHIDVALALPLPGARVALRHLVEAASARAFTATPTPLEIDFIESPPPLARAGAVGLALLFTMFAVTSLMARGMGDHEEGLGDRLSSLRVGVGTRMAGRCVALTIIGGAQMCVTMAFALVWLRLRPAHIMELVFTIAFAAVAIASTMQCLACLCGTRARFAAVAPVVVMALGVVSGAMVPLALMPESFRHMGEWVFVSWATVGMQHAIDGLDAKVQCLSLLAWATAMFVAARALARGEA